MSNKTWTIILGFALVVSIIFFLPVLLDKTAGLKKQTSVAKLLTPTTTPKTPNLQLNPGSAVAKARELEDKRIGLVERCLALHLSLCASETHVEALSDFLARVEKNAKLREAIALAAKNGVSVQVSFAGTGTSLLDKTEEVSTVFPGVIIIESSQSDEEIIEFILGKKAPWEPEQISQLTRGPNRGPYFLWKS